MPWSRSPASLHHQARAFHTGFCLLHPANFICRFHKPLDIDTPIEIGASMESIRTESQPPADHSYSRIPLDFTDPTSIYWSYHIMSKIRVKTGANNCPIERSTNGQIIAVWGFIDILFFAVVLGFACVHLIGWNRKPLGRGLRIPVVQR